MPKIQIFFETFFHDFFGFLYRGSVQKDVKNMPKTLIFVIFLNTSILWGYYQNKNLKFLEKKVLKKIWILGIGFYIMLILCDFEGFGWKTTMCNRAHKSVDTIFLKLHWSWLICLHLDTSLTESLRAWRRRSSNFTICKGSSREAPWIDLDDIKCVVKL